MLICHLVSPKVRCGVNFSIFDHLATVLIQPRIIALACLQIVPDLLIPLPFRLTIVCLGGVTQLRLSILPGSSLLLVQPILLLHPHF